MAPLSQTQTVAVDASHRDDGALLAAAVYSRGR
jgi:hypothetical protein